MEKVIDKLNTIDYGKLIRILMLMEANSHLSASSPGLKERENNRKEAIKLLQSIIKISDEQLEEMYQLFID